MNSIEILKKARENSKLSQEDMADKLGIGLRMYQKIEAGQFPKYKTEQIKQIDKILNTNLYELIYEQNIHKVVKKVSQPIRETNERGLAIGTKKVTIDDYIEEIQKRMEEMEKRNQLLYEHNKFLHRMLESNGRVEASLDSLGQEQMNLNTLIKINLEHTANIEAKQEKVSPDVIHGRINTAILNSADPKMDRTFVRS